MWKQRKAVLTLNDAAFFSSVVKEDMADNDQERGGNEAELGSDHEEADDDGDGEEEDSDTAGDETSEESEAEELDEKGEEKDAL